MEQNARIGFRQHGGVIVRVASGNGTVINGLQRADRLTLRVSLAQLVVDHSAAFIGDQTVAEQCRKAQLAHQRLRELIESIRQNDDLKALTQPVDKLRSAFKRLQGGNHFLNILNFQVVLIQNTQALLHQYIVIGDIARGRLQLFDTGFLGKLNPDFRNQYTLKIKTRDFHEYSTIRQKTVIRRVL